MTYTEKDIQTAYKQGYLAGYKHGKKERDEALKAFLSPKSWVCLKSMEDPYFDYSEELLKECISSG